MIRKTVFQYSNLFAYVNNFNYGLITVHLKPTLLNDTNNKYAQLQHIFFGFNISFFKCLQFQIQLLSHQSVTTCKCKKSFHNSKSFKKKISSIFFFLKVKPIFCIFGNYKFYNSFSFHAAESSLKKLLKKYLIQGG